jgi:polyadenylation factor subunit 2
LAFHPIGHLLVTGSNDHTTRFWARERPGDATSVFSGGGEKPPEQDPEAEDDFEGALPGLGDYPGDQDDSRIIFDPFHTAALSGGGESSQGYSQMGRSLSSQGAAYPGQNEEHGFSQGKTRWGP